MTAYTRRGLTGPGTYDVIDQLTYTYSDGARPDKLSQIGDTGSATKGFKFTTGAASYSYDSNGNMTQDNHKSLTINYNYLTTWNNRPGPERNRATPSGMLQSFSLALNICYKSGVLLSARVGLCN